MTGRSCGESLDGPAVTVAPAMKWLAVSIATVSLVQSRDECLRPARLKKYREVWRLSRPVPSTAAVGAGPIRPESVADVVAQRRRPATSPFLAAVGPHNRAWKNVEP